MHTYARKVVEKLFNVEIVNKGTPRTVVNQAVNLKKRIIFIAIPKTGTSSIRAQIREQGTPIIKNGHLNAIQIRNLLYVYVLMQTLGKNSDFPNEGRPNDAMIRESASEIFDSCFKFSAVRNPWARAVSLYFRREGVRVSDMMSFDEFCEKHMYASDTCRQPTLHKAQYDWLSDEKGKLLMDYVYKVEELEDAILKIEALTGGKLKLRNIRRNINPESRSSNYRQLYNSRTRRLIARRFEKDIDYFKYTF